jgi:hypothetical protein
MANHDYKENGGSYSQPTNTAPPDRFYVHNALIPVAENRRSSFFLAHHRIPMSQNDVNEYLRPTRVLKGMKSVEEEGYRRPTAAEAAAYFKITSKSTIYNWWDARDKIFPNGDIPTAYPPKWPGIEEELVKQFQAARKENKIVKIHWFQRMAQKLWCQKYPHISDVFVFSNGWFWRFLQRSNIVRRRITKAATTPSEETIGVTNNFIQYIRKHNRRDKDMAVIMRSLPVEGLSMKRNFMRLFPNNLILNLDETPLPFEFLNGYSYNFKKVKTVAGKFDRSGWDKRQATIILYIMADGSTSFKPVVVFHGKGTVVKRETYDERVEVHFDETAYNNEELFHNWLQNIYQPYVARTACGSEESLIVMDAAAFHKTETILQYIKQCKPKIRTALIPSGLTSLVQPLDTAVNAPFKKLL